MTPAMEKVLDTARTHARAPGGRRMRRIVVRMAGEEVERLDAVRAKRPGTSRAAIIRALTIAGLAMLDAGQDGAP